MTKYEELKNQYIKDETTKAEFATAAGLASDFQLNNPGDWTEE